MDVVGCYICSVLVYQARQSLTLLDRAIGQKNVNFISLELRELHYNTIFLLSLRIHLRAPILEHWNPPQRTPLK